MAALPGVSRVVLNSTVGKITIEGDVDVDHVLREAKKENYRIVPEGQSSSISAASEPRLNLELVRALVSGLALGLGFTLQIVGLRNGYFISFYALALVLGGYGNARKAYYALPKLDFNMSVLMTFAMIGAVGIGKWEEAGTVAFLYSVSDLLESWSMEKARRSIRELMDLAPKTATIRRQNKEMQVPVAEVGIEDILIVHPGEKVAMDGRILKGSTSLNEAAITGESIPVDKGPGDDVYAATLNTTGVLEVAVTKRAEDTTIAKIIHLVEEAQSKRAPAQAFVDRFATIYTPIVLGLAVVMALVPPLLFGFHWDPWIYRGLALLIVSCPCALVVSTPVAMVSAISTAARNGVLIKGGIYLEQAGALKVIAFDKTGTLTEGHPAVTDVIPVGSYTEQELLQTAASLEIRSDHPLAKAIVESHLALGVDVTPAEEVAAIPGRGVRGTIGKQSVYVGNLRWFRELGIPTGEVEHYITLLQNEGKTSMVVGTQNKLLGVIAVADKIRTESKTVVAQLRKEGIEHTILLTGDNQESARAIATATGVDEFRAELLPQDKVESVKALLSHYGKVAMVGDGINDAPALATATIGIAMGKAGTDTAMETADITLMSDDLGKLPFLIHMGRRTMAIIRQNITFSIVVKVIAVLLVFPGWLTLWLAILADMGASLLVTLNGIRLLRVKEQIKSPSP